MMNKIQNKNIILALSLLVIFGGALLVSPQKASALNASYNITETTSGSYVSSNNNGYDGSMYGDNGYNSNNYTTNNVVTDNTNYNATPIIYSITPNSAVSGNNNILVTITGSNFSTSATARFNGSDKETRYYDNKHLGMVLSPIDLDGKGTYLVSVYNPSNGSVSNGVSFTLNRVVEASSAGTTIAKKTVAKTTTATTVAKAKTTSTSNSNNSNALTANALSGSNGFLPSSLIEWLLLAILIFLVVILVRKTYMAKEEHAPLKHA